MTQGWQRLWSRKGTWLLVTAIAGAEAGLLAWWLTLPVATAWDLVLHVVVLLAMAAFAALAWRVARRALPGALGFCWPALPVALAAGVGVPALLLWWVPGFESIGAQAASLAVRFLLAGVLFTGALLWLAACSLREEA
jgi:hypothetical protein